MSFVLVFPDGTEQTVIPTHKITLKFNNEVYEPAFVTKLEMTANDDATSETNQCGVTEVYQEGVGTWNIVIEGYITDQNTRLGDTTNLDHTTFKTFHGGGPMYVNSRMHSGEFVATKVLLNDPEDVNFIRINGRKEYAFGFQLQLKSLK